MTDSDRTWARPRAKHLMRMGWHDLLFAHWDFDPAEVNALLPSGVSADTYDGRAWVAVVPFRMSDVAPRGIPALPRMSAFPELNVRTYVTLEDKPGVWFFSLDAANRIAVRVARGCFHLPYMDATMAIDRRAGWYNYESSRTHTGQPEASFLAKYRPAGDPFFAQPGSLEYWLTARYCLYTNDRNGRILRGEIDHPPWPLQDAECRFSENTMLQPLGLSANGPPHLLFARDLHVVAWRNAPLDASR